MSKNKRPLNRVQLLGLEKEEEEMCQTLINIDDLLCCLREVFENSDFAHQPRKFRMVEDLLTEAYLKIKELEHCNSSLGFSD